MRDLLTQTQVLLRDAGYGTHELDDAALSFEDDSLLGFVHVFPEVSSLLERWSGVQRAVLARCAPQLRMSSDKAWNVYAVFLTEMRPSSGQAAAISLVEEDFTATRKIARAGVTTGGDLRQALLPLLPIRVVKDFAASDYVSKLRSRLGMLPAAAVDAIVGSAGPADIARILMRKS